MFRLSLPPTAKVIGYGLDINNEMLDGVIVPKEKARRAFDQIVDAGIDPGIAEVSKSNTFRTEIYPVLPNKARRVYVQYIEKLTLDHQGSAQYSFPFSQYNKETDIRVNIEVTGTKGAPKLEKLKTSTIKLVGEEDVVEVGRFIVE